MKNRSLRFVRHLIFVVVILALLLFLPYTRTDAFSRLISGDTDAAASASVILDAPSGNFVVLINKKLHTDEETLNQWRDYFSGKDVSFIMEDISCSIPRGDSSAKEMADSFRSRLAANQMKLYEEDPTMLMSRADQGKFDIILLSKEYADSYQISTAYNDNVVVVSFKSDAPQTSDSDDTRNAQETDQ